MVFIFKLKFNVILFIVSFSGFIIFEIGMIIVKNSV